MDPEKKNRKRKREKSREGENNRYNE